LKHSEQEMHMVWHDDICEKEKSMLCASLTYLLKADIALARRERKNTTR